MKRGKTESTPIGEKLRAQAIAYASDGQKDFAHGLSHVVDGELAPMSAKAVVDLVDGMLERRLTDFVADVVSAVRDTNAPALPRPRKPPADAVRPSDPPKRREPIGFAFEKGDGLSSGERALLTAIAQHMPKGASREQLTALVGFKKSYRDLLLQRLTRRALVAASPGRAPRRARRVVWWCPSCGSVRDNNGDHGAAACAWRAPTRRP